MACKNFGCALRCEMDAGVGSHDKEDAMRKLVTGLATLAAIAAGVTMFGTRSEAAGLPGSAALNDAADSIALTRET